MPPVLYPCIKCGRPCNTEAERQSNVCVFCHAEEHLALDSVK